MKIIIIADVALLLLVSNLLIAQKTAQRPTPTTITPGVLERSSRLVSGIKGSGRHVEQQDYIRCANPNSTSPYEQRPWSETALRNQIRFDYATADNRIIGSWTVRALAPDLEKMERQAQYYFDGTFTSGNIDVANSTYELRGTTSFATGLCRIDDRYNYNRRYNVRIWGSCGNSVINFEATDPNTGALYATATFSNSVEVTCGPIPLNGIRTDYHRH